MQLKKWASFLLVLVVGLVIVACDTTTTTTTTTTATPTTTTTTAAPTTTTTTTTAAPTTTTTTTAAPTTTTTTTVTTTTLAPVVSLLSGLKDGHEGVYSIAVAGGVATIAYNKHVFSWPSFSVDAVTENYGRFNKLVLTVAGEGNLLVRLIGAETLEVNLPLTAVNVTYQIDLRTLDAFLADFEAIEFVVNPGVVGEQGELVLSKLEFDTGSPFGNVLEVKTPGFNAMYDFVSNDAGKYVFTTNIDGSVKVAYDKPVGFEWAYIRNDFNAAAVAGYNTLTISIQGIAGKEILLKPNDFWATEQWVQLNGTIQTFTFTAASFQNFILIAEPNTVAAGEFTIHNMTLSYVPETDYGFFGQAPVELKTNWTGDPAGLDYYDFELIEGALKISWDRPADKQWTWLRYNLPVYYFGVHNTLIVEIQGTAGQQVILKPLDKQPFEKVVTFTGEVQTIVMPTDSAPINLFVFSDPINGATTGEYTILSMKTAFTPAGNNVTQGFAQNDPATYEFITNSDGSVTVQYERIGEWVFARNNFDAAKTTGKNTMLVLLSGTPGKSVLLKPNDAGALERWVTFTDENPIWVWVSAEAFTNLLFFAEPGVPSVAGSFVIHGVWLSYEIPLALPKEEVVDFTFGWYDNGNTGMYTFATVGTKNVVTYNKTSQYNNIKYVFEDNLMNLNTLTLVLKGTAGKSILVKPNDKGALEFTVNFTGEEQTIEVALTETLTQMIIFAEINQATASGSFEIISATVSWKAQPLVISAGWAENDVGTYAIVVNGDKTVTVNYTKTAQQTYVFMINNFDAAKAAGLNTMTIVVQGTDGKTLLIKPNDSGPMEQLITFNGTQQTFTFTSATGFSKLLLFAEGGTPGVSGTFTIVSLTLSYVPPVAE